MGEKVVIIDDRYPHYNEEHEALARIQAQVVQIKGLDPAEIRTACCDAAGIIVNLAPITADLIAGFGKCRVISRYGVGYDAVDVPAATAKKIWVANVPDYCEEDVSDQAFGLFMSCVRKIALRDRLVRAGTWDYKSGGQKWRITGKTFVFFGFGRIARTFCRKLSGFELGRVLVFDPFLDAAAIKAAGAEKVDFETALKEGDFFSIHMPLNAETRGLFNEAAFRKMKPTAIVINTSRGPIIDEPALHKALTQGWINSAGLDVFINEPVNNDNPLLKLDNITVSGHEGWYSEEAFSELKRKAAENVVDTIKNGRPRCPVNKI